MSRCTALCPLQLAETEQQYAEIYEAYEKDREFFPQVEAAMHKASQEHMKEQRQWKEASEAAATAAANLEKQLGSERAARDAAEARLATLQDQVQQLEDELAALRREAAACAAQREAALAGESTALAQAAAAAQTAAEAEARALQHAEQRDQAEHEAAKARVDAQR
jgi:chromosome segregation ATPase